jgi:uncharacterized membrane protein YobD (UPF0266 family)
MIINLFYNKEALPVSTIQTTLSVRTPHTGKSAILFVLLIAVATASALSTPVTTTLISLALLKTGNVIVTDGGFF